MRTETVISATCVYGLAGVLTILYPKKLVMLRNVTRGTGLRRNLWVEEFRLAVDYYLLKWGSGPRSSLGISVIFITQSATINGSVIQTCI
jgi:hypothetical protein